jgi:hypothetical protein
VEEFVACGVWPLSAGVNFDQVSVGVNPVLKLKVPLPNFVSSRKDDESDIKFQARVVSDAKVIVGSYTCPKHDACIARLHNEGRLNHVLELTGLTYGPHLVPSSDASTEASKKRKTYSVGKVVVKRLKVPEKKRAETSAPRGKGRFKRLSNAEVASAKPIKLSKKNVPHAVATTDAAHSMLGASSPKSAAGALSSKIVGGTSGSKLTALNSQLV